MYKISVNLISLYVFTIVNILNDLHIDCTLVGVVGTVLSFNAQVLHADLNPTEGGMIYSCIIVLRARSAQPKNMHLDYNELGALKVARHSAALTHHLFV